MIDYRVDKVHLLEVISMWNGFIKRKVHLIACGGTALTLLGLKDSTKDIDLMIPEMKEYSYLIDVLKQLGYKPVSGFGWARGDGFVFDLFPGKKIHTTELLASPLAKDNNVMLEELTNIYLGILNDYDLIISKLFRGSGVDFDDCLILARARQGILDFACLEERFRETSSYDVAADRVNTHLESFLDLIKKEGIGNGR